MDPSEKEGLPEVFDDFELDVTAISEEWRRSVQNSENLRKYVRRAFPPSLPPSLLAFVCLFFLNTHYYSSCPPSLPPSLCRFTAKTQVHLINPPREGKRLLVREGGKEGGRKEMRDVKLEGTFLSHVSPPILPSLQKCTLQLHFPHLLPPSLLPSLPRCWIWTTPSWTSARGKKSSIGEGGRKGGREEREEDVCRSLLFERASKTTHLVL